VGLFKQMKDMKKTVEAAPGMISQAQQLGAQAQEMAAAQQAAAQAQMAQAQAAQAQAMEAGKAGADMEPIAGVSLEQFATISKGLAAHGYDQSKAVEVAASHGVSAENWQQAMDGWNDRIKGNPAIAQQFNKLYMGS
jgi:hypothetical protein